MKKLERLWPEAVYQPVVILHPVLLVAQQPVVDSHQPGREVVRFFYRAHDANRIGLALHETFDAGHDRRRRRTMAAACVGRDDEDFRTRLVHLYLASEARASARAPLEHTQSRNP